MMTMKSCFSGPFLLLLLLILFLCAAASGLGSVVIKRYWHSSAHDTWHNAQRDCRSSTYFTDVATVFKQSDEARISLKHYRAWIGLSRSTLLWKWDYGPYYYISNSNWATNEPHNSEDCAFVLYNNKKLYGARCEGYYFFFCRKKGGNKKKTEFIPQSKTWTEAQDYCKSQSVDLAYVPDSEDVTSAVTEQDFPVWIGLHREGGTWKWSSRLSDYRNWAPGEPSNQGDCVSISSKDKKMSTQMCSARLPYVCYRDNLVLVKENKTWEEALEHCQALGYKLLSVQPGDEHQYVTTKVQEADTEEVWTGLRFLAGRWLWVNKATVLYPDLPLCPPEQQHCGALSKNDMDGLLLADCAERRNFLCYSAY